MPNDDHLSPVGESWPSQTGNQLFQLAATLGIAHTQGQPACLPDDWDYREFFSIPAELFGTCGGTPATDYAGHIDERARAYLQDWNLFVDIMPTLRHYLQPSNRALEVLSHQEEFAALPRPILSVHVRRGDNVPGADPGHPVGKEQYHPLPPLKYYMAAMECVRRERGEWASVAVFGDDPEWNRKHIPAEYHHAGIVRAKEHLPEYHTDPAYDWIDWFMQASCEMHVCSNSTFGIMAAIIAAGGAVVPWPIFGPALDYIDASLMIPDAWKRLEYSC